jgi:NADPH:quinone reductase-like Zn-dependent oxidoreductase
MKSIVHTSYGSSRGVELRDVETPAITDEQVLVRVHASSVNPAEWYAVMGPFFARFGNGLRRPKTPKVGADLAGHVVAVGKDVTEFKPGDEVFGTGAGAWSEYAAAREVPARREAGERLVRRSRIRPDRRRSPRCRPSATTGTSSPGRRC